MASNFAFLAGSQPDIFEAAAFAELLSLQAPRAACFHARFALETSVQWLYEHDPQLRLPYDYRLGALIHEESFKHMLPRALFPKVRTVLKVGNHAAHDRRPLTQKDSVHVLKELFHFLFWLARTYAKTPQDRPPHTLRFDPGLLTNPQDLADSSKEALAALEKERNTAQDMARIAAERQAKTEAELEELQAEIARIKAANEAAAEPHDYNEAETRAYLIDIMLKEAGWDLSGTNTLEYPVKGMPLSKQNPKGGGKVDYVLWGEDGRPLALVEAKRSTSNPKLGKQQAKLYADCLEARFKRRPIIFYSNGYETWLWDDFQSPPRPVQGFYRQDELERLMHQRTHRTPPSQVPVDEAIAGRPYQKEAIQRVSDVLEKQGRKALIVMATGTGKTRTAVALVDVLRRAGWVKRVLFLADRTSLVRQAKNAFQAHLPSALSVNLLEDKTQPNAAVTLATYQTLFNLIAEPKDGERSFGPGHFDLVIIDEAHRSVYKKYGALFDYFDAYLLGLTATPRAELHKDTFKIFELEKDVPTFQYELDQAVKDGYLVPHKAKAVPLKFLERGIKYKDLSDEEKEAYEEALKDEDTGELPGEVSAAAINQWLFNTDTVDKALGVLMDLGLKIHDGDRLGKTIIFARNHNHAEFIVERFDLAYPHFKGAFARVIDSHDTYAQSLLDTFSTAESDPMIAVSVDMLDTGVDVPEVLNLVFFKPVRSHVKFHQMIGRGTRLCPDLFGPGEDKDSFLIFDLCRNFEFFEEEAKLAEGAIQMAMNERLLRLKMDIAQGLEGGDLKVAYLDSLHQHVMSLNPDNILVRPHLAAVHTFQNRDRWKALTAEERATIEEGLLHLPSGLEPEHPKAKQFDLYCLKAVLALLTGDSAFLTLRDKIRDIADSLRDKATIPAVKAQLKLLSDVVEERYWEDITPEMVEDIRLKLRGLAQYIEVKSRAARYTDFADDLNHGDIKDIPNVTFSLSPTQYRKKVETILRANAGHIAIAKLKRNQPLTALDLQELDSMLFTEETPKEDAWREKVMGEGRSLGHFVRSLVGLDRAAAKVAFEEHLRGKTLTSDQLRFMDSIIDYLTRNGVMDPGLLYEPPFTDIHHEGVEGVFGDDQTVLSIVDTIRQINQGAGVDFREVG